MAHKLLEHVELTYVRAYGPKENVQGLFMPVDEYLLIVDARKNNTYVAG